MENFNWNKFIQQTESLEKIDIEFLMDLSKSDAFDSFFMELFNLVDMYGSSSEVFVYSKEKLIFSKRKEAEHIEIRDLTNSLRGLRHQEYVFIVDDEISKERSLLFSNLTQFLSNKKIDFSFLNKEEIKKFTDINFAIWLDRNNNNKTDNLKGE